MAPPPPQPPDPPPGWTQLQYGAPRSPMARQNGPVQSLTGTAASSGIARGPWILVAPEPPPAGGRIDPGQAEGEIARLAAAAAAAGRGPGRPGHRGGGSGHPPAGGIS